MRPHCRVWGGANPRLTLTLTRALGGAGAGTRRGAWGRCGRSVHGVLGVLLRGGCALTRARARCETCRFGTESLFVAATRYRPFSFNGEIPLRNSPERKMAVSGLADVAGDDLSIAQKSDVAGAHKSNTGLAGQVQFKLYSLFFSTIRTHCQLELVAAQRYYAPTPLYCG